MPVPAEPRATLRFAPSPNGRLHLGHAYSALLNAQVAAQLGGRLLLRIEDIDPARSRPELVAAIHDDLAWLGLSFEDPVRRQSAHLDLYRDRLADLTRRGLVYPCFCSRGTIAARVAERERAGAAAPRDPDGAPLYPGTCRGLTPDEREAWIAAGSPHTWRLDMERAREAAGALPPIRCFDPEGGEGEAVAEPARWGDAVVARRDVPTSYHLAVVIDDAAQGVTHVVRGEDLRAATGLHVLLQALLGLDAPAYHHHRLIRAEDGGKLAKSRGSESLADLRERGVSAGEIRGMLGFRTSESSGA